MSSSSNIGLDSHKTRVIIDWKKGQIIREGDADIMWNTLCSAVKMDTDRDGNFIFGDQFFKDNSMKITRLVQEKCMSETDEIFSDEGVEYSKHTIWPIWYLIKAIHEYIKLDPTNVNWADYKWRQEYEIIHYIRTPTLFKQTMDHFLSLDNTNKYTVIFQKMHYD
jgi:hypothetical protein